MIYNVVKHVYFRSPCRFFFKFYYSIRNCMSHVVTSFPMEEGAGGNSHVNLYLKLARLKEGIRILFDGCGLNNFFPLRGTVPTLKLNILTL